MNYFSFNSIICKFSGAEFWGETQHDFVVSSAAHMNGHETHEKTADDLLHTPPPEGGSDLKEIDECLGRRVENAEKIYRNRDSVIGHYGRREHKSC